MLQLNNAALSLGQRVLVRPFSLDIAAGETVTLMGPSGSGKSSLLAFLGGNLPPGFVATGEIVLNDRVLNALPPEHRRLGRLFQDDLLFPHMTVLENLLFATPGPSRHERRARAGLALAQVELSGFADRAPHTLSGGQRARVALARVLLSEPGALLLDEPFNKLDQDLRETIRTMTFDAITARGIPAILVTHDKADAPAGGRVLAISGDGELRDV